MMKIEDFNSHFQKKKESAFKDYFTFLSYPSVSSEEKHKPDVLECADWLVSYLKRMGFTVELWKDHGHPVIFASFEKAGTAQPTLLIYNHYDVQPVDPLELWDSPPFKPTVKEDQVFARGAQDNKGQCFYVLLALQMLIEMHGTLPINIKLCIEGEEECGSTALTHLLELKKQKLKADYLAIVDVGIPNPTTPAINLGVRGIITMDVLATGTKHDLHSGLHGGLAYNPIHALVSLLATCRDPLGKITIPGFYDAVRPLTKEEKTAVSWDFDSRNYRNMFGVDPTGGEAQFSPLERNWSRPTLEINGISGGYSGDGFKTVIPAQALAKVSCRLVPNQEPQQIFTLIKTYLEQAAPDGIKIKVTPHGEGGLPMRASPDNPLVKACKVAYESVFKIPCKMIYDGASIPITSALAKASGAIPVLIGLGLPDDCIHAPNEHFGLDRIERGTFLMMQLLNNLKK